MDPENDIWKYFNKSKNDVIIIDFICPITKEIIKTPVRGKDCPVEEIFEMKSIQNNIAKYSYFI